jgi:hypothetical protein
MLYVPSIEMVKLDIQVLPSSETIWLATPEEASVPMTDTVAGETCQPFAPSAGGTWKAAVGGVVSSLTVLVVLAVLPALSLAVTWTVVTPSVEMVRDGFQVLPSRETAWLARPEVASEELAITVTGETYQPFEPLGDVGFRDVFDMGGVRSTVTVTGAAVVVLPATSVARKMIE